MTSRLCDDRIMNREVLAVVDRVWHEGGGKLKLPSREDVPVPADAIPSFKVYREGGAFYAAVRICFFEGLVLTEEGVRV